MAAVFVWNKEDLINCSKNSSLTIPHKIQSLDGVDIRNISTGQNHTLICLQDGSVRICVHDSTQDGSQSIWSNLGDSNLVKGLTGKKVIQVAAGSSHSVVLTEDHKVYTWGQNDKGQLGRENVNRKNRNRPKLVQFLANYHVLQISCGNDHTLALTNDGQVFVWGSNSFGQLGLGESLSSHQNVPAEIKCLRGIPVLQIVAGGDHSFILSKSGSLFGWGRNDFGQLGLNKTENEYWPNKCRLVNDQKIMHVCCGENHTACLTKDGCVLTFGAGSNFQLGHCSNKDETTPKKVMELSGSEVSQIACGREHTIAYAAKSGILYVFGQGGNGQFGMSSTENNNSLASFSGPFVLGNQHPVSYFSMQLDNQGPELRIKAIQAGGNQSLIIVVPANTSDSDDFRKAEPAVQILTLSEKRIQNLQMSPDNTPSEKFLNEIGRIFSSPSCLNGSFLLSNDEHYGSSSKKHGVDMNAAREFFKEFAKTPDQLKFISTQIQEHLIPKLSTSPPDVEALRLHLILPECRLFDQPEFYSSVLCQFAKTFISLGSIALKVFDSWWSSNQPSFFKRLVVAYKQCLQYLLWLPYPQNTPEDLKRNEDLLSSVEMLKKLYEVNQSKSIIDDTSFIVPELKDKVNIQNEYPVLFFLQHSGLPLQGLHLCNYPFLFDGESKSILLQTDADLQKESQRVAVAILKSFENPFLIQQNIKYCFPLGIDRQNLVNGTLNKLRTANSSSFKLPLGVHFEGEKAGGDGVLKEFFLLFFQELAAEFDMFTTDDKSQLQWFNSATSKEPEIFRMIGILFGLVIYNTVAIDLHFPLALYKKLLKKSATHDDLIELMPVVGKNFQNLLNDDDVSFEDKYSLTFEWTVASGSRIELCPGGADTMVNQSNKHEYVDLCVDYLLNKSVNAEFDAFNEGFHSVCGGRIMDSFRPEELRSLVEGNEDYDFFELEKNTSYEGGVYYRQHQTIMFFWEVFHEMSLANKKKFLLFLTGSDRIPITGMKNIQITIRPSTEEGFLPMTLTCHKLLFLPSYTTKQQLETSLLTAIQCTQGFLLNLEEEI